MYCSVTACFGLAGRVQENHLRYYWKEMKALLFVEALASSRKASVAFVMPVRPCLCRSVCIHQHGSHWTDLGKI